MIVHFLALTLPYVLGVVVLCLVFIPLINYALDPKDLRRFPSPSVAAATTPFWRMWHNLRFNHYAAIDRAHKQLGTHVRIAPNHISILDPQAPYEVYGHGANMLKEQWYDAGAGAHRNLADTRDKSEHQAKRKMLAHAFAAKTVVALEPLLVETIASFMKQLDRRAKEGKEVNIRLLMNYFTIDLFGCILYSERLGCLDRGDDILHAESPDGRTYMSPFIQPLLDATVINNCLAFFPSWLPFTRPIAKNHPYKKAGTD